MTTEECHLRAAACVASAEMASDVGVASEFMALAAHWRAMAVREIFFGNPSELAMSSGRSGAGPIG